ncbi:Nucleolar Complex 2 protein, partial [Nowakowskiella sp. JEL0078]
LEDDELIESDEGSNTPVLESEIEEHDGGSDMPLDEIDFHKKQLESLKQRDPDFYEFLSKNDQTLLNFGDNVVGDEESDDNEINDDNDEKMESDECKGELLTMKMQSSQKSIQKILLAVRAAVAIGKEGTEGQSFVYRIEDGKVFNALVMTFIKNLPVAFNAHLLSENDLKSKRLPSQTSKWRKLQPLAKSFVINLFGFLKQMTDPTMLRFVLNKCEQAIPYIVCFPKLGKEFVKLLVSLWGGIEQSISVIAFLNIRKLALWCPSPYLDLCLKGLYVKFVASCRNASTFDASYLTFMTNCITEICGLNQITTYQHAFGYIRQLAIHLRNALTSGTKDAFKVVYNWQYLHCLRVWVDVLSMHCKINDTLKPLVYPLVQVIIGAVRLKPSTKYIPYRLQLLILLNKIAKSTENFIPIVAHVLEIFECNEIKSVSKKKSTLRPFDVRSNIKVANQYLGTKQLSDSVIDESVGVLLEFFDSWATIIGFPELVLPALVSLRRLKKRGVTGISSIVEKIEQNARWIELKRAEVGFSPRDEEKVLKFTNSLNRSESPLCKYVESRRKVIEQQMKIQATNFTGDKRQTFTDESDDENDEDLVEMDDVEENDNEDSNELIEKKKPVKKAKQNESNKKINVNSNESKLLEKAKNNNTGRRDISNDLKKEILALSVDAAQIRGKKGKKGDVRDKWSNLDNDDDLVEDFVLSEDD